MPLLLFLLPLLPSSARLALTPTQLPASTERNSCARASAIAGKLGHSSPTSSAECPTAGTSRARSPTDMVTYCYHDRMAYAPAAASYDDAVSRAQAVFPSLAGVDPSRLSLHVMGRDQLIRIPKMAWTGVLLDLDKYEVIHVEVDDDAPPRYHPGTLTVRISRAGAVQLGDELGVDIPVKFTE
ncbi:hypothetical protein K488DRAFT_87240 [Vararia minispora EC-137]|uniref:Uncharacterized protein n=1 Tax=Vararia minispora EC-137 TaxID=1314806 RepID=A0ACB8QH29_9AGAM|nr:hypothetical protein K488DRAFT_87240 [Vararia minispora EC-137]